MEGSLTSVASAKAAGSRVEADAIDAFAMTMTALSQEGERAKNQGPGCTSTSVPTFISIRLELHAVKLLVGFYPPVDRSQRCRWVVFGTGPVSGQRQPCHNSLIATICPSILPTSPPDMRHHFRGFCDSAAGKPSPHAGG